MRFNLIELHFDSLGQMRAKTEQLSMRGVCLWSLDEIGLTAQFDVSGCKASDLPELFEEI